VRTVNAGQCVLPDIVIGRNTNDACGSVVRHEKPPAITTGRKDCPNVSLINGQASVLEILAL
jgi:serine acetyltransferase